MHTQNADCGYGIGKYWLWLARSLYNNICMYMYVYVCSTVNIPQFLICYNHKSKSLDMRVDLFIFHLLLLKMMSSSIRLLPYFSQAVDVYHRM